MAAENPEAIDLDFDEPTIPSANAKSTKKRTTRESDEAKVDADKEATKANERVDESKSDSDQDESEDGDEDHDDDDEEEDQSEEDDDSESEEEGVKHNASAAQANVAKALTPAQKKLQELRAKLLQARDENKKDVIAETKRMSDTPSARKERMRQQMKERQEAQQEDREKRGDIPLEVARALNETVEEKQLKDRKYKKKKKDPAHSYAMYNGEADYTRYKKRAKRIPYTKEDYENMKKAYEEKGAMSAFYGSLQDNLDVGHFAVEADNDEKDLMVEELRMQEASRAAFSRRRPVSDREMVTYINERNRVFNKKAARAYDQYTAEVRQNLERGTAL
eukprot:TRINITY_DN413_c0_g2_i1.p1 TRINITY_DN413_c0_g2~~TRINITY_DN413_c0_g2_i1.p1  ORF type:complete len:335 (-),score=109.14 TRINITY_DN413_c0_g2_i1:138-1142(-)